MTGWNQQALTGCGNRQTNGEVLLIAKLFIMGMTTEPKEDTSATARTGNAAKKHTIQTVHICQTALVSTHAQVCKVNNFFGNTAGRHDLAHRIKKGMASRLKDLMRTII